MRERVTTRGRWYDWDVSASELVRWLEEMMAARDHITNLYPDHESSELDLAALARQSQDILLEQLRDRFERVVDAFVRYRLGSNDERSALLHVLFDLYEEGLLTKAEVRRRGRIEPEDFYDELRAYRTRSSSR